MIRIVFIIVAMAFVAVSSLKAQMVEGDDGPLRLGRFEANKEVYFGLLGHGGIHQLDKNYFNPDARLTGKVFPIDAAKLLVPLLPGKVIIASPMRITGGKTALLYDSGKPLEILPTGAPIVLTAGQPRFSLSAEMVIVVGEKAEKIKEKNATNAIAGVTIAARIYSFSTGRVSKIILGPWLVPGLSHNRLRLEVKKNGKTILATSTRKMPKTIEKIIAGASQKYALVPGDIILTGFPSKRLDLVKGDKIEIMLEGVGVLRTMVVSD